jgi:hypothetical protein
MTYELRRIFPKHSGLSAHHASETYPKVTPKSGFGADLDMTAPDLESAMETGDCFSIILLI